MPSLGDSNESNEQSTKNVTGEAYRPTRCADSPLLTGPRHRPGAWSARRELAVRSDTQTTQAEKRWLIMKTRTRCHPLKGTITLVVFATLTATLLTAAAVSAKNPPIAPPDEPGPFNVGWTTFLAPMSGGRVTQIRVFYPTLEEADHQTQYTIHTPVGTYQLDSPLWAVQD